MNETISTADGLSELARRLGQRGGRRTKRRGSAYYARIGRLGAQKRWHPDEAVAPEQAGPDDTDAQPAPGSRADG
jgi:hypothetical protein